MSITSTNVITTSSISLSEIERYIALTTRWVYASDCSSRWRTYISRYQNGPPATQSVYNVLNPFSSESIASDTSFRTCLPYAQSYTSQYSPGVCPDGSRLAMVTEYHVQNAMGQSSTDYAGPCCGSGMTYDPSAAQCTATFTRPLQVLLPVTSTTTTLSTPNGTPTTVTDFTASWTGTLRGSGTASDFLYFNYTTLASGVKVEDPIFVGWALRDLDVFPTDYASSLAQTIGVEWTAAPGGSPTGGLPRPTSNSEPGDEGTGSWTTGAKVGIGLGISLGALVVLGLLVFCILRRRMVRIRQAEDEYQRDMQAGARGMPELADQDQELKSRKWFLGGKWRSEVGAGGGEGKSGVNGGHAGNGNRADYEIDSRPVHVVPGPPVEMDAAQMYYGGGR